MNPYDVINHFYPQDTPLRRLLLLHSEKVRDKAFSILAHARLHHSDPRLYQINEQLVNDGALLHDIGIYLTDAPGILCTGTQPYILHGTLGADLLRDYARQQDNSQLSTLNSQLEKIARICERHTGVGLTRDDILRQNLPITPVRDLVPETLEEQLVCLADKFFSKSGDPSREKPMERVKHSMMKFGTDSMARFEALCTTFSLN